MQTCDCSKKLTRIFNWQLISIIIFSSFSGTLNLFFFIYYRRKHSYRFHIEQSHPIFVLFVKTIRLLNGDWVCPLKCDAQTAYIIAFDTWLPCSTNQPPASRMTTLPLLQSLTICVFCVLFPSYFLIISIWMFLLL